MCLQAHYRSKLDFTWESLEGAKAARRRINDFYWGLEGSGVLSGNLLEQFEERIADNLDTPMALSLVFDVIAKAQRGEIEKSTAKLFLEKADSIFQVLEKEEEIPQEISELVSERERVRLEKNFAKADEIRRKIEERGYKLEDIKGETKVKRL
jgi:cysteinyl-tRNA synthetase